MKQIIADRNLVAYCGLYCGACRSYLKEKCPGCQENAKASWCQVRLCCLEKKYASCADCTEFANASNCQKFNNIFSKLIGFCLRSNRQACITAIKTKGCEKFAQEMANQKKQTLKR
jgi:hypothetical protein